MTAFVVRLLAAIAAMTLAASASAQTYPSRPVTLLVPFAAGGNSDVIARTVAEQMTSALGQPVVIENIGGSGGWIALGPLARADAGG